jgi:hypothetical protein
VLALLPTPYRYLLSVYRSDAWLAVLRLDLPEDIHKKVLAAVPDTILPALTTPLMLAGAAGLGGERSWWGERGIRG